MAVCAEAAVMRTITIMNIIMSITIMRMTAAVKITAAAIWAAAIRGMETTISAAGTTMKAMETIWETAAAVIQCRRGRSQDKSRGRFFQAGHPADAATDT